MFLCSLMGWASTVRPHTPELQSTYSTAPVSPTPIIQSPEENLILRNPCPCFTPPPPSPHDKSDKEDEEGTGFGSGGGGGSKKKRWRSNYPPWSQWILQERLYFLKKMGEKRRKKVKGGRGRLQGCSRHVGGGSEALEPIRGGGGGVPFELRPAILREEGWVG